MHGFRGDQDGRQTLVHQPEIELLARGERHLAEDGESGSAHVVNDDGRVQLDQLAVDAHQYIYAGRPALVTRSNRECAAIPFRPFARHPVVRGKSRTTSLTSESGCETSRAPGRNDKSVLRDTMTLP